MNALALALAALAPSGGTRKPLTHRTVAPTVATVVAPPIMARPLPGPTGRGIGAPVVAYPPYVPDVAPISRTWTDKYAADVAPVVATASQVYHTALWGPVILRHTNGTYILLVTDARGLTIYPTETACLQEMP